MENRSAQQFEMRSTTDSRFHYDISLKSLHVPFNNLLTVRF